MNGPILESPMLDVPFIIATDASNTGLGAVLRTHHTALQWLENFRNPRCQVARWLERLIDFDFEVEQTHF